MAYYTKKDMQEQEHPIYDFFLSEDGQLQIRTYTRYIQMDLPDTGIPGRPRQEYHMATPNGIVRKTDLQIEKFLNGHLYSFNSDKFQAKNLIAQACEAKVAAAKDIIEKYEEILTRLRAPSMPMFGGDNHD